ncbi:MAG: hypothetical protein JXR97_02905, partial [Planctomycetes bacterium]|nr:hypothetical protein [Planctomycetota bacterium]
FMKEILNSEGTGMFYVPQSASITPYDISEIAGDYDAVVKKREDEARQAAALKEGLGGTVTAAPVLKVEGFQYEPPVRATLVYKVYRFRYEDTDNAKATASTGKTN